MNNISEIDNRKIFWILLKTIVLMYVLGPIISNFFIGARNYKLSYILQIVLLYAFLLAYTIKLKKRYMIYFSLQKLFKRKENFYYLFLVVLLAIGFDLFLCFEYNIPFIQDNAVKTPFGFTKKSFSDLYNSVYMICTTSIIIPILEELYFRGILFNLFLRKNNIKIAIILPTVIFSLLHPTTAIFVLPQFLVVTYLYFKVKNIVLPITYHITVNLFSVILVQNNIVGFNKNMNSLIVAGACIIVCVSIALFKINRAET